MYILIFVQMVAESFPISSSGHVALLASLLGCSQYSLPFLVNVPFIVIVPLFFKKKWVPLLVGFKRTIPIISKLFVYVVVSDCVTAAWYFFLKVHPIGLPLFFGFTITAIALFSLYMCPQTNKKWSLSDACILGFVQGFALLPGISRLGLTYVAARWLGISSERSFQISWLIMWPLLVADTLKMVAMGIIIGFDPQLLNLPMALVILVGSRVSWYGMGLTKRMVAKNKVARFSWYMVIPIVCSFFM